MAIKGTTMKYRTGKPIVLTMHSDETIYPVREIIIGYKDEPEHCSQCRNCGASSFKAGRCEFCGSVHREERANGF